MMNLNQGAELTILAALLSESQRLAAKLKANKDHPSEQLSLRQLRAEHGFWQLHYSVVPWVEGMAADANWPLQRHEVYVVLQLDPQNNTQLQLELNLAFLEGNMCGDKFRFSMPYRPDVAARAAQELTDLMLSLFNKKKFNVSLSRHSVFTELMARTSRLEYDHSDKKEKAKKPAVGQQQPLV